MSLSLIRTQVKEIVEGVSGCGNVYDYQRFAADWAAFLALFKSASKINGWVITRLSSPQRSITIGEIERAHIFFLRKYYGLDDSAASEKTFQDHLEDVNTAFLSNETLNSTCDTTHPDWGPMAGACGLAIDTVDLRVFGSVLCHFAECRLCAIERVEV